jgi:small subunit ribosomal protein S8
MQDPISDMLTRIRNAYAARLENCPVPHSKIKMLILDVLKKNGYIRNYNEIRFENKKNIDIKLKYYNNNIPVLKGIKRVSKPSCRIYVSSHKIPRVMNGFGTAVISTNNGIVCDDSARKLGIGGEVICFVW